MELPAPFQVLKTAEPWINPALAMYLGLGSLKDRGELTLEQLMLAQAVLEDVIKQGPMLDKMNELMYKRMKEASAVPADTVPEGF